MDWWLFTFFIGAIFSLFSPIVPALFQLFCLLFLTLFIFYYKPVRTSSGLLFGMVLVLFNGWQYQTKIPNEITQVMLNKQSMKIEGEVLNIQSLLNRKSENGHEHKKNQLTKSHLTNPKLTKPKLTKHHSLKLNVNVTHINDAILEKPFIVRLNWRKPEVSIMQGQMINVYVKLKPAHGLANLGSFNYQAWLRSQQILATGYVTKNPVNKSSSKNTIQHDDSPQGEASFRQKLFNQYKALLPEESLAPLLLALGFGERSSLLEEHWDVLKATGTGHLIAISGLHIGLVASGSYFIVMLMIRIIPAGLFISLFSRIWPNSFSVQHYNIRYIAIIISILLAFIYGYLAGFSLPTQRALVMLSLYWLSRIISIHLSIKRWLLITLFILVIMNPFSLFTASFWLSVYAVSIIFLTLWRFRLWLNSGSAVVRFVKSLLIIQCSLTVMILPITALFFHEISTVAFFANMLAVPWMSLLTIPLTLLSVLMMEIESMFSFVLGGQSNYLVTKALVTLSIDSINLVWRWLNLLTSLDSSTVNVSLAKQIGLVVFGIFSFYILFLTPTPFTSVVIKRIAIKRNCSFTLWGRSQYKVIKNNYLLYGLLVLFGIFITLYMLSNLSAQTSIISHGNQQKKSATQKPDKRDWQLIMFDVGQGLSVLIKRGERAILYDTGAAYPSGFTMSDAVILPYLQYANIKELDNVILSHSDNDHAGGIKQLQGSIKINQLITNDKSIINLQGGTDKKGNLACHQGNSFDWEGFSFQVLWPLAPLTAMVPDALGKNEKQRNDDSCVLLISIGSTTVLLTGDISKKVERKLIKSYPDLKAKVLIVPHHGSNTSSSDEFLNHLSPEIALVSAGFINRWKMPTPKVVSRYAKYGIPMVNTADSGQVIISFNEGEMKVNTYRAYFRPFWFSN